ncbi:mechanosensitive ion channel family protein [Falsihalocynthiibacter arcticus]|uniref:DUF3772 domain-containing protein n=1 Tax=Falsihalocynthiibacter arcticus TaxID=1579316 RepID=A0A126V2N1_9RHOB|nr:mechanosensitive ion channel domain-containing protein [Falsihalocynthiibacter arcticus]AML52572.1 hypothetical protein RC74_16005 [Falsihalocynthiibacter arcticus]
MQVLSRCGGVFRWIFSAVAVCGALGAQTSPAVAQSSNDASAATIPIPRPVRKSETAPEKTSPAEEAGDDGSFEILRTLRSTVLENGKTYGDWETFSKRAQKEVVNATETTENLESLRKKIVVWRDLFLGKEDLNSGQISTLDGQIEALSPTLPSGSNGTEEETAEIVKFKLKGLEKERAVLRVPSLAAAEAFALATGLIREIDRIINARKRSEFLVSTPSPILPQYWAQTIEYLYDFYSIIPAETRVEWHKKDRNQNLLTNAPRILLFLLMALVMFLRWGTWMSKAQDRAAQQTSEPLRRFSSVALSALTNLAPIFGILLILKVLVLLGLFGSHGLALVSGLGQLALMFVVGRWLGQKVFPRENVGNEIFHLTAAQRAEARFYTNILSVILGLSSLGILMFGISTPEKGVEAVLVYPLILGSGLVSFRLVQLFRKGVLDELENSDGTTNPTFRNQVIAFISRLVMIPAILGPILATLGYYNAGVMVTSPLIPSLALLAVILILHQVSNQVYDLIAWRFGASQESIIPVLVGFVLAIGSIPLFAIIAGVRPAQIFDYWNLFLNGFTFGTTRVSPSSLLLFLFAFGAVFTITRLLQGALRSTLLPKTTLDIGGQNAIVSGLGYVGIFLAGLAAIMVAGIDLSSLAIVAGALSVGIGFGLQNIVSNFVSGIILLAERPISEGDWIETSDGQMGYVRDISVRSTRIETFDRTDVIIPNGDLVSGVVTNWTRGNSIGRLILPIGVAYDSDSNQVADLLLEVANGHPMVLATPEPKALFRGFGASSLDFELRLILRDINWKLNVQSDLNHEILRRFNEAGISIPFPQSDLWLRNPEDLKGFGPPPAKPLEEPSI